MPHFVTAYKRVEATDFRASCGAQLLHVDEIDHLGVARIGHVLFEGEAHHQHAGVDRTQGDENTTWQADLPAMCVAATLAGRRNPIAPPSIDLWRVRHEDGLGSLDRKNSS